MQIAHFAIASKDKETLDHFMGRIAQEIKASSLDVVDIDFTIPPNKSANYEVTIYYNATSDSSQREYYINRNIILSSPGKSDADVLLDGARLLADWAKQHADVDVLSILPKLVWAEDANYYLQVPIYYSDKT